LPLYTIQDNVDSQYASDVNQLVEGLMGNADIGQLKLLSPLTAPTAPTAAVNTNLGNLTGAYKYVVAFVTGYWHGEPVTGTLLVQGNTGYGTESNTINPNGQQGAVSAIPTGPTGTVARILGRTKAGGSAFYRLAQINDNTTTSWTDNTADAGLTVELNQTNTTGSKFVGDGSGLTNLNVAVPVSSVNSKTGAVVLTPSDVGAETPAGAQAKADAAAAIGVAAAGVVQTTLTEHQADYVRQPAFGPTTGVANAYVFASTPALSALVDGVSAYLDVHAANTGASTLNWNGTGVKAIVDGKGSALIAGKMPLNGIVGVRYNASTGNFQLLGEGGDYGTAGAAQTLTGYTLGTNAGVIPGTMPSNASPTTTITTQGGTATVPIGYGPGGTITASLTNFSAAVIAKNSTVGGVAGTYTSDANAVASQILAGLYAYVNGVKLTGTMPEQAGGGVWQSSVIGPAWDGVLNISIPEGRYFSSYRNTIVDNLYASNIVAGVKVGNTSVAGGYITGTASNIKSIQSGFTTMGAAATTFINISAVDPSKSVVRINTLATSSAANTSLVTGQLANATQVRLNAGAASTARVYWTVIEYNNAKSVQRGAVSVATTDYGGQNFTISAVNPLKSELIVTKRTTDPAGVNAYLASYNYSIADATTINIVGGDPTYPPVYEWQLIEFN